MRSYTRGAKTKYMSLTCTHFCTVGLFFCGKTNKSIYIPTTNRFSLYKNKICLMKVPNIANLNRLVIFFSNAQEACAVEKNNRLRMSCGNSLLPRGVSIRTRVGIDTPLIFRELTTNLGVKLLILG